MSVNDIIRDQDEMKAHTYEFILWPRRWQDFQTNPNATYDWTIRRLDKSEKNGIPDKPGIYTLLIQPGIAGHPACSYLMYVGQAQSLRHRFEDYLGSERRETGRPKIFRLLNKYSDYIWFCFTPVSLAELDNVEKTLIKAYEPPCNNQIPAEVSKVRGAFK